MAAVRIENDAWRDPRYAILAKLSGLAKARFALITCGEIWSYCTDRKQYVLPAVIIDTVAEVDGFAEHMVSAGLAEKLKNGDFRIRGAKGRIEWLEKKRESGAKGGQQKAARRVASADQVLDELLSTEKQTPSGSSAVCLPSDSVSCSYSGLATEVALERETLALESKPEPEDSASPSPTRCAEHDIPAPCDACAVLAFDRGIWDEWRKALGLLAIGSPNYESLATCRPGLPPDLTEARSVFRAAADAYVASKKAANNPPHFHYLAKDLSGWLAATKPAPKGPARAEWKPPKIEVSGPPPELVAKLKNQNRGAA